MNYKPFCGYWFYGGASQVETCAFYCSWGLMAVAAIAGGVSKAVFAVYYRFRREA